VKRGLRAHSSIDITYLLTSDAFESEGQDLEQELEEFGYNVERSQIDAFDLRDVVDTIVTIARSHAEDDLYINITGGTNLVAGAATSSAFFIGATPYYVLEPQEDEEIEELVMTLPAPTQPLNFELGDMQLTMLQTLKSWEKSGKTGVIMREIGDSVGESAQQISYHVRQLENRGLVERRTSGRSKKVYLTDVGRLYLQWTE
jgi:CRISPR locus-related DNA-binding protein